MLLSAFKLKVNCGLTARLTPWCPFNCIQWFNAVQYKKNNKTTNNNKKTDQKNVWEFSKVTQQQQKVINKVNSQNTSIWNNELKKKIWREIKNLQIAFSLNHRIYGLQSHSNIHSDTIPYLLRKIAYSCSCTHFFLCCNKILKLKWKICYLKCVIR